MIFPCIKHLLFWGSSLQYSLDCPDEQFLGLGSSTLEEPLLTDSRVWLSRVWPQSPVACVSIQESLPVLELLSSSGFLAIIWDNNST